MTTPVVEIRSLHIRRGGRDVLKVERLDVDAGEVLVMLGPNGAGKSSLMKCLIGLMRPNAGEVRVLGHNVQTSSDGSLCKLRRRIGYVPQVLAARSETPLTVREVAAIGRTSRAGLFRPLKKTDWSIIDDWLERLGLTSFADAAYAGLSGGEQRKTLIAKAMVQEPEMLLLDEPTANLDLYWREQIVDLLERLYAETGLTILMVCHELEAIPPCCRRLLVLRDGRPIADGTPETVLDRRLIETMYGSRLKLLAAERRYAAVPAGKGGA